MAQVAALWVVYGLQGVCALRGRTMAREDKRRQTALV